MMTMQRYLIAILALLTFALFGSASTKEQILAGIQLGDSKDAVVSKMGYPSGKMTALPPTEIRPDDAVDNAQAQRSQSTLTPPNVLVFYDYLTDKEVWIGESTIVLAGASSTTTPTAMPSQDMPAGMGMGMGMPGGMGAPIGMGSFDAANNSSNGGGQQVFLPVWAYTVRANALGIDQEQLIYRLNETYSVAVTLTKKNGNFQVTDIVACSFEPLKRFPAKPGHKQTEINFSGKTAITSGGVKIGSTFASVLAHHGWTQYCFAYPGETVSKIEGQNSKAVPVPFYKVTGTDTSITVSPEPDLWENNSAIPGDHPVRFTDGKKESIRSGFSRNCVLLYPDDGVSFTVVDMTVVRIQIGSGVVAPKPPKTGTDGTIGKPGNTPGGQFNPGVGGQQGVDNPWF